MEPSTDIWLMPGDYLNVKFKASPSGRASFSIDNLAKKISMTELAKTFTGEKRGFYNGTIKIPNSIPNKALTVKFELVGKNGKKTSAEAPGKVFILPNRIPITGMTKGPVYMFSTAFSYSPFSHLPDSVRIQIIGKVKDRYKINLGYPNFAFIESDKIKVLPLGTPLPVTKVSAPTIQDTKEWWTLSMWTDFPVPFKTILDSDQQKIELCLYGANKSSNWTTIPNYKTEIDHFAVTSNNNNELSLIVKMDQKFHWGHKVEYKNGQLLFSIRKSPQIKANPLHGIKIAIDAGHGGENEGTKSPIGLLEKDVNLRWAFLLKKKLENSGAQVIMTRRFDEEVSLEERLSKAIAQNALLFISLHNNSTTPTGNPITAKGTSTYYTLEQNRELAWTIFPHLSRVGLAPYGRVKNSYYLTNSTEMITVLIEGLFMSNPMEEKLLLDDAFLAKMASAVQDGIQEFLANRTLTE
jgi:N-acetylmuramoyl-L-alanine amidase